MGRGQGGAGGTRTGVAGRPGRNRAAPPAASGQGIDWAGVDAGTAPLPVPFSAFTKTELQSPWQMVNAHGIYNAFAGRYGDFGPGGPLAHVVTEEQLEMTFPGVTKYPNDFKRLLNKLPDRSGESFHRGEFHTDEDFFRFVDSHRVGTTVDNPGFLYTSRDRVNRYGFSDPGHPSGRSLRIFVNGKTGKDIGPYFNAAATAIRPDGMHSKGAEEYSRRYQQIEQKNYTIFRPGTKFRVTSAQRSADNVYEIHYEEV